MTTKHRARITVVAAALLGLAGMLQSGEVAAQASHGCACLHNNIQTPINYRFRWGTGDWKAVALPPSGGHFMCWAYKDAPKSPDLQFQLDTDLTSANTWKTFAIKRGQAKEASCGATPSSAHYHVGYLENSNKKKVRIFNGK